MPYKNGAAVVAPPGAMASSPGAAPAATEIERSIGLAVADAVVVLYQAAIAQQECGLLPPAIKDAGGARIAAIATMQLDHEGGDLDFITRAHRAGKRELRRYFSVDFFQQHGPGEVDMVLDVAINSIFEIVTRVVKDERVFRAAWAN